MPAQGADVTALLFEVRLDEESAREIANELTENQIRALGCLYHGHEMCASAVGEEVYGIGQERLPQVYARPGANLVRSLAKIGLVDYTHNRWATLWEITAAGRMVLSAAWRAGRAL